VDAIRAGGRFWSARTPCRSLLTHSRRILCTKHVEEGKGAFAFAVLNELEGIVA